ncbi:ATP-dependent DNA helicase UvrD2 [Luteococcus sp. Sow4_B9]|uniref:ATP-dependent DNA helicase UvrD2 n=1 Tax=Luteococcus sp. Sow4_B9 TaxID=3438792 RepID=UPI003F94CE74
MSSPAQPPADPSVVLEALDAEQRQVATTFDAPVAVIAGAGTGKTRAITHRIAYGALTGALDPRGVLAVTFTTRAAGEMRSRLHQLGVGSVQARTFHSAALRQIQFFWPRAYGVELPEVTDRRMSLVAEAASRSGLQVDTGLLRDLVGEISWAKVSNVTAGEYPAIARAANRVLAGADPETVARVFTAYETAKRNRGQIDFDDILLCTAALLSEHEDVAMQVRQQYRHFVVDEYQDVSPLQQTVLNLWLGERRDLCVVGDPHQSIHAFAGARADFLTGFAVAHPGTRVIRLVRDYRSTPQVVDLANKVMAPRRAAQLAAHAAGTAGSLQGVNLVAQQPSGPAVEFGSHPEEAEEARAIAEWLTARHGEGVEWREMAVLFRINAQSPVLEAALSERRIPYLVRGSDKFYERPEIRQALAQLRAAVRAEPEGPGLPLLKDVLAGVGWSQEPPEGSGSVREKWESLNALVDLAHDIAVDNPEHGLVELVGALNERAALQEAPVSQGVTLGTLHASKGLEWDAVALFGMQEGTLPFVLATTPEQLDEEKRLLYVGITRARRHLRISWSRSRTGGRGNRGPSRFLDGLTPAAVAQAAEQAATPRRRNRRSAQSQTCRVCHKSLGTGAERKLGRHEGCPSDIDEELLARLKAWRLRTAQAASLPAFVIFTDATLVAVAESRPRTEQDLLRIAGIGRSKLERHGADLLALVAGESPGADEELPMDGEGRQDP